MRVTLLQPHTHAGREYPAGATLTLPLDAAEWLVAIGVAQEAPTDTGKTGKKE